MNAEVTPPESETIAGGNSQNESAPKKMQRVRFLVTVVLLALIVSAGITAIFGLRAKRGEEIAPARTVPEAIGPRSIFEGIDRLERAHWSAQSNYLADVNQLIALYARDDKQFTPAWKAAVSNELSRSNLFVRVLPTGFEATLRQGETRWLMYSREGASTPRITTLETDGQPPFGWLPASGPLPETTRLQLNLTEYREPRNYFSAMLPEGFEVSESGQPPNIRVSFVYTNRVRLMVKAMESNRGWEPLSEMTAKAEQIQSGTVPAFADFRLVVTNLLDVEGGTGYEMGLLGVREKAGVRSHTFAFGGERTMLSIAVLCPSESAAPFYESLLDAIRDTLRVGLGPQRRLVIAPASAPESASASASAKKGVEPEPPPLTEEEKKQWAEARGLLKTTGIMRSGEDYVALVNDQLLRKNDVVTVSVKGKAFRFRIRAITTDNVDFEPLLSGKGSAAEEKKGL